MLSVSPQTVLAELDADMVAATVIAGKLAFAAVNRLGERLPQTRALAGEKVSRHLGFGHQQVEAVERAGTTSTWHATRRG
ncbi:hypothetical protein I553_8210 [Mycobacterium xenopi 4042]|uniref:Uncharacterized protein n=1 Tax=Mycobacterium xenopi 4042 TaxID=1299334 RepID=X8BK89_MYCXE|nr:hypothetical protein I553_8210 [Mycobacterium xenopi 4042]